MYLLDTNVVSELHKAIRRRGDPRVTAWLAESDLRMCFLSVITLMELETGVLRMERRDVRQGAALRDWLEDRVIPQFDGRVLPVDAAVAPGEVADGAGSLVAGDRQNGSECLVVAAVELEVVAAGRRHRRLHVLGRLGDRLAERRHVLHRGVLPVDVLHGRLEHLEVLAHQVHALGRDAVQPGDVVVPAATGGSRDEHDRTENCHAALHVLPLSDR